MCVENLTDKLIFYGSYKSILHVTLPFVGHLLCYKVKLLIKSVVFIKKCMFDLKFLFVNNFTVDSFFRFKDCLSLDMKSHVVYCLLFELLC